MKIKVLAILIIVLSIIIMLIFNRILLKLFTGSAQILTPNDAIIFTNEKINSKAKLFRMYKKCDGSIVDRYVLWIPSEGLSSTKTIVMIDITSKDVGIPNSSDNDYQLYFGYFWGYQFFCVNGICS